MSRALRLILAAILAALLRPFLALSPSALTGRALFKSANLINGQSAISSSTNSTAVALPYCTEALVIVDCTAVVASGVLNPIVVQASPDGGTTWATATGGTLSTVSAVGRQAVRITGLGGANQQLRLNWTLASGTSVTLCAEAVGFFPEDSANVADQI